MARVGWAASWKSRDGPPGWRWAGGSCAGGLALSRRLLTLWVRLHKEHPSYAQHCWSLRCLFLSDCISSPSAAVLEFRFVIFLLFFVILLPMCNSLNICCLTLLFKNLCLVAKSFLTLFDPMDCSPPGSSVLGIFQARILEWVAVSFSRGSIQFRDWTHISCIGRRILYHCATWEAPLKSLCICRKNQEIYIYIYINKCSCGGFILIFGKTNTIM